MPVLQLYMQICIHCLSGCNLMPSKWANILQILIVVFNHSRAQLINEKFQSSCFYMLFYSTLLGFARHRPQCMYLKTSPTCVEIMISIRLTLCRMSLLRNMMSRSRSIRSVHCKWRGTTQTTLLQLPISQYISYRTSLLSIPTKRFNVCFHRFCRECLLVYDQCD